VVSKDSMTPLLAIFALRDIRIHVGLSNGSNKDADVEAAIDEFLCYRTAL